MSKLKPGDLVYHVASPEIPGRISPDLQPRYYGRGEEKVLHWCVHYLRPHPKFRGNNVWCSDHLLCKSQKEARERHIPEEIYNQIAGIIES